MLRIVQATKCEVGHELDDLRTPAAPDKLVIREVKPFHIQDSLPSPCSAHKDLGLKKETRQAEHLPIPQERLY